MEEILQKCLQADNEAIQQGTQELKEALKRPEAIAALCNVVVASQDPMIRQYAAVVLSKRLSKHKQWAKIATPDRETIKQGILDAFANEAEKVVRNSLAHLIGVLQKHEAKSWPKLTENLFLIPTITDKDKRELYMFLLSTLVDMNPKLFQESADALCGIISQYMKSVNSVETLTPEVFHAIDILKSLAFEMQNVQVIVNTAYEAVPVVLNSIEALAANDEERAVRFIQLLDDLSDNVPLVFDPHLTRVAEMCLTLSKDRKLGEAVRMKALNFLGQLVAKKKKTLCRNNMLQPILDTLFEIVATESAGYEDLDDDVDTPATVANQTLDTLALNLPPAKVVTPMLKHIDEGIKSDQPYRRRAALLAMAVMAEGAAEYIRTKHLAQFIPLVLAGIKDEFDIVRSAALFALGQFSEHMQPDIANYSEEVMPVLLNCLGSLRQLLATHGEPEKFPEHITRMFYALEMFCENLNVRLKPFLPTVVDHLLAIFCLPVSAQIRELAISALNSTASAAKEDMAQYVPQILERLNPFLTKPQEGDDLSLQIHAVDSLAVFARTLGRDNFYPLAPESLKIALTLVETVDDPDLRKTAYGLLGALSAILKEEMGVYLETIVNYITGTLTSEEGNAVITLGEVDPNELAVYDDASDENDEEDIDNESDRSDEGDGQVHIDDAYTEEKEQACSALGELAKNMSVAFQPYFERCMTLMVSMINHPGSSVRCAALAAFAELTVALGADRYEDQQKALSFIVPKCAELIPTDYDREVVAGALDALDTLLVNLKGAVLQAEGHEEAIINSMMQVLTCKTQCQEDEEDGEAGDEGESEQDELIFEYAGNLLTSMGKAQSQDRFLELFKKILPFLLSKVKDESSVAQKSFVAGTLGETMAPLGDHAASYFAQLLPLFLTLMTQEEDEVRNNAIFALGELILHSKQTALPNYPSILGYLSAAIARETVPANMDNICAALARMIVANPSGIPYEEVLPALIAKLPLREDFEENASIFQCLNVLYEMGNATLREHILPVIRIALSVIYKGDYDKPATLELVLLLLKHIKEDFRDDFDAVMNSLNEDQRTKIIAKLTF